MDDPIWVVIEETVACHSLMSDFIIFIDILIKRRLFFDKTRFMELRKPIRDILARQPLHKLRGTDCIKYNSLANKLKQINWIEISLIINAEKNKTKEMAA